MYIALCIEILRKTSFMWYVVVTNIFCSNLQVVNCHCEELEENVFKVKYESSTKGVY